MLNISTLVVNNHIIFKMKHDDEFSDESGKSLDFYLKKKNRKPKSKSLKKFRKSSTA